MRERALSDFADPPWGAARINNIGISRFSPETSDYGARRRVFDLLVTAQQLKGPCTLRGDLKRVKSQRLALATRFSKSCRYDSAATHRAA